MHSTSDASLSLTADTQGHERRTRNWQLTAVLLVSVMGLAGVSTVLRAFWTLWTGDPLRSIGGLFLPVSALLIARVWREHDWVFEGSWWGALLIALAFACNVILSMNLQVVLNVGISVSLTPLALPMLLYGSGVVLLFAGPRVCKAAWFPLLLLLLLNPLPTTLLNKIDFPLQTAAANVTRKFATLLRFQPSTPELTLMFSPRYGMFIAPGCDGSRGAVTLGYLALILGFVKKLSMRKWALFTTGAIALGYVLNFMRLCLLVVYYRVTLGKLAWEYRAPMADYVIGGTLCLIATFLFFSVYLEAKGLKKVPVAGATNEAGKVTWAKACLVAAMALLPLIFVVRMVVAQDHSSRPMDLARLMPQKVGEYQLTRTWLEYERNLAVVQDGAYSKPGTPGEILLGIWLPNMEHNALDCWKIRGETPEHVASPTITIANGQSISFDSALFDNGTTFTGVWTSRCTPTSCSDMREIGNPRFGLRVFSPTLDNHGKRVYAVIRIETPHSEQAPKVVYDQLFGQAKQFVSGLDLMELSKRFQ